jgi:hypothetical protein
MPSAEITREEIKEKPKPSKTTARTPGVKKAFAFYMTIHVRMRRQTRSAVSGIGG